MTHRALERVVLGWNRNRLDLASDEVLAQILDRGDLASWQELFGLAAADPGLRARLHAVLLRVPVAFPSFWLAALASLGEAIDWGAPRPADQGIA